jgi:hypothetical protein
MTLHRGARGACGVLAAFSLRPMSGRRTTRLNTTAPPASLSHRGPRGGFAARRAPILWPARPPPRPSSESAHLGFGFVDDRPAEDARPPAGLSLHVVAVNDDRVPADAHGATLLSGFRYACPPSAPVRLPASVCPPRPPIFRACLPPGRPFSGPNHPCARLRPLRDECDIHPAIGGSMSHSSGADGHPGAVLGLAGPGEG